MKGKAKRGTLQKEQNWKNVDRLFRHHIPITMSCRNDTFNPLTWHTDTLRFLTVGIGAGETVLFEAACFGAFLLVSFWFAVRTLQRAV